MLTEQLTPALLIRDCASMDRETRTEITLELLEYLRENCTYILGRRRDGNLNYLAKEVEYTGLAVHEATLPAGTSVPPGTLILRLMNYHRFTDLRLDSILGQIYVPGKPILCKTLNNGLFEMSFWKVIPQPVYPP